MAIGLGISFLGTLPLGTLNISAMQLAVSESVKRALLFALGVALVEITYVRFSLKGVDWIMSHQQAFRVMEWITVAVFLLLGINSLIVAGRAAAGSKNIILNSKMPRFLLGMFMSAINPAQIPFWFLWSSYLMSVGLLKSSTLQFNLYTLGIGLGTCTALLLFIYGGRWIVGRLQTSQRTINLVVGLVFVLSAFIQLYRILKHLTS
ncbi:putative RhtB family transporter [Flavihumibacter petaseus NBRC 106054]|uniref:Putative RhtB family transporter n=2 Tax=Flavihumibacter TaxID=1004301 RepID=A0A0E9N362_9BACT|nr:putative RhtB family transporter [Flavihumibacter petaseus NBRC 106054]